jgi:hypothetical protein
MNWIKQNQLLAVIAALGIVGSVVFGWLAYSGLAKAGKSVSRYKSAAGELARLYDGKLYPTAANLEAKQSLVAELTKETLAMRAGLAKLYGASQGGDPATFGQRVQRRFEAARKVWEARGMKVPENFFLGMDSYRKEVAASPVAVPHLDAQLEALAALAELAAESGIASIDRFERSPVRGEAGVPARPEAKEGEVVSPLYRYPVEVRCTGTEESVRAFVNGVAAANKHFFAFRAMRLQNDSPAEPKREDTRAKVKAATAGATDLFAELALPADAAPAPEAQPLSDAEKLMQANAGAEGGGQGQAQPEVKFTFTKPGVQDAYQFLGNERVKAAIRLDVVFFEPPPATEEAGAPAKP